MYWHIGKMKTASTFLQRNVFSQHSEVAFLGWRTKVDKDPWTDPTIDQLVWSLRHDSDFNIGPDHSWWEFSRSFTNPVLISDEGIGTDVGNWSRNLRRIKSVDPTAKVLWFVRNQPSYLLSQYFQYQRGVFGNKRWPHISLSAYFDSMGGKLANDCFYAQQLQEAKEVFGAQNILVIPFELLHSDSLEVASKIAGFMGISSVETQKLIETSTHAHVRPVGNKIERSLSTYLDRQKFITDILSKLPLARRLAYQNYDEVHVIAELERLGLDFRLDNTLLAEYLNCDLNSLGYPT